jgi:hypothetical protein
MQGPGVSALSMGAFADVDDAMANRAEDEVSGPAGQEPGDVPDTVRVRAPATAPCA